MEYKKIFQYRSLWMAFAILWIVFFHADLNISNEIVGFVKLIGYGGVDIFVFASGLGCFFSYSKDENIEKFFKRRAINILPSYWLILIFWIIFKIAIDDISWNQILGNIFCVQRFTGNGNDFNWYISGMWLFYVCVPFFYIILIRVNKYIHYILILLILTILSIPFWSQYGVLVILTRIPTLFLGMLVAFKSNNDKKIHIKEYIGAFLGVVIGFAILFLFTKYCEGYLWLYGLWWYPFILITPGLCLGISLIAELCNKTIMGRRIIKAFSVVGSHTFEIFLVHIWIFDIFRYMVSIGLLKNRNLYWLIVIICTAFGSFILAMIKKHIFQRYIKL